MNRTSARKGRYAKKCSDLASTKDVAKPELEPAGGSCNRTLRTASSGTDWVALDLGLIATQTFYRFFFFLLISLLCSSDIIYDIPI